MKTREKTDYRQWLVELNNDELDNERYTLTHERQTLNRLSDDQVADRLMLTITEQEQRLWRDK